MPHYKLTYFNFRGRGECIRLMFALAGVEYEDCRIDKADWPSHKHKMKFGRLPLLEIDGEIFSQSMAIFIYLATEFGYYGKTTRDILKINEVIFIIEDLIAASVVPIYAPDERKGEAENEFRNNQIPKFLTMLEMLLKESKTNFFVGDKVTVADISCYDFVTNPLVADWCDMNAYPCLKSHIQRIGDIENIKKYVAQRPAAMF